MKILKLFLLLVLTFSLARAGDPPPEVFKQKGFTALAGLGILANNGAGFAAHLILGSQINEFQSIGVGIGTTGYDSLTAMPIFLDLRRYFLSGDLKPFLYAEPGYALAWREHSDGNVGGVYLRTGAGLKAFIGTDFAFFFDGAFIYQSASRKDITLVYNGFLYEPVQTEYTTPYRSFQIEIGLAF
ncbi:MAG TPA: hypothetical protein VMW43_04490 [Bacteroidota bacterium]|nr:hypothetical protein [Bacteroidota bacterium]